MTPPANYVIDTEVVNRTIELFDRMEARDPDPRREAVLATLHDLRERLISGRIMRPDEVGSALREITQYLTLLEQGSLGTASARDLRRSTSLAIVDEVLARSGSQPAPETTPPRGDGTFPGDELFAGKLVADMPTLRSAAEFLLDSLVDSAVRGDSTATEWLLQHVRPLVVRYCEVRLPDESVDEVAQEVLLTLFRALPSYHNEGYPFMSFVLGIASHKIADLEAHQSIRAHDPGCVTPDLTEPVRDRLTNQMEQLLAGLSPRQREVLILRVVVGLSAHEVADIVRSTPGAIRATQHRAVTKLRKAFAPDELRESPPRQAVDEALSGAGDDDTEVRVGRYNVDDLSPEVVRRIVDLAEEFGWQSALRIHSAVADHGITLAAVRHVLNHCRPGAALRAVSEE